MSVSAGETDRDPGPAPIFRAQRSDSFYARSACLTLLVLGPLAFLAPATFLLAAVLVAGMTLWNRRTFRLQVTERFIRFRPSALWGPIRIPLAEVAAVEAEAEAAGAFLPSDTRAGRVVLRLRSGLVLPIAGIIDAGAAARAIVQVKRASGGFAPGR